MKKLFIFALILPLFTISCSSDDDASDNGSISLNPSTDDDADEIEDEFEIEGSGESDLADESNSYLLTPGSSVKIPVSRAYKVWSEEFATEISGTAGVEIVWIDNDKGIGENSTISSYELVEGLFPQDAYITVNAGSSDGNAVIAYTLNGDIYWSWHIWVTDYDPDNGGKTYYHIGDNLDKGHTFMDRNLGALAEYGIPEAHGFLYQWGRKDPFPGPGYTDDDFNIFGRYIYDENGNKLQDTDNVTDPADGIADVYVSEPDNMKNSVMNPKYYYIGRDALDGCWWGTQKEVTALWTNHEQAKSVFDPCPVGWRVASGERHMIAQEDAYFGPWSTIVRYASSGESYMFFDEVGYIPLFGDKVGYNGQFSFAVGVMSCIWTADYYDFLDLGIMYLFYAEAFNRNGSFSGAHAETISPGTPNDGFAVRCERE